jgi:O-antigen ligase
VQSTNNKNNPLKILFSKIPLNTYQYPDEFSKIEYLTLVFSLLLYRLPVIFPFIQFLIFRLVFLLLLFWLTFINIRKIIHIPFSELDQQLRPHFLFVIYLVLGSYAFCQSVVNPDFPSFFFLGDWLGWFFTALFFLSVFLRRRIKHELDHLREGICLSIIIYIAANVLLYFLGVQQDFDFYFKQVTAVMARSLGIYINRVVFPTAPGINSFGIIAGAGAVVSTIFLISQKKMFMRLSGLFGLLSSIFVMILTDSRGALVFSLIAVLLSLFPYQAITRYLRWSGAVSPLFPFAVITLLRIIPTSITNTFSRPTANPLSNSIISGRLYIWDVVIDYFRTFDLSHLTGLGYRGQAAVDISSRYSSLFKYAYAPEFAGAHNQIFQTLIEMGYSGILLVLIAIAITLYRLSREEHDIAGKTMFFVMIYFILAGITESVLTLESFESTVIFLMIWLSASVKPQENHIERTDVCENVPISG